MAFWLRDYDRRQQQLAAKKQAEVQTKLINEYTEARYNLQKEIGAATGNPEKIAELQQKVKELDDKYKEDMQATADLRQYIEDEEDDDKSVEAGSMEKYLSTKFREGTEAPGEANLRRQAEMHDKQAGDEQKNAQQNFAVANRDYRGEAEKNAVSQAASENAQKVANMGNVSAAASALARGVKSADYNTHMQRQDQQRAEGVKNQREMWSNRQVAEYERSKAKQDNYEFNDMQTNNLISNNLSKGNMLFNDKNAVDTKAKQSPAPEQKVEEPVQEEQPAEETQQPEEPNLNGWTMYDVQNAINIVAENNGQLNSAKTNEYMSTRKAGADPQQERQKLAPLVEELSSSPEKYEEYAQWLAKERGGNISVNKNTEIQKAKGSTMYPQTDESQQNIANTLEQSSKYN